MANIFKSLFGKETAMEEANISKTPEVDYDKIYGEMEDDHLVDIVKLPNGEYVIVDTQWVENGITGYYETMAFHCDENGRDTIHQDYIVGKQYNITTDFDTIKESHTKICNDFESEGHYHGISKSASYAADIGREDYANMKEEQSDKPTITGMDMSIISINGEVDNIILDGCTNIDVSELGDVDTLHLRNVDMNEVKLENFSGHLIMENCSNLKDFDVSGVSELEIYDCNTDGFNIENFNGDLKVGECEQNQAWLGLYVYKEWHDNGYQEDKVSNDIDNDMNDVDNNDINNNDINNNDDTDWNWKEDFIEEPQSTRDNDLDWNDANREDISKEDFLDYNDIISNTEKNIDNNIDSIISEAIEDSGLQDDIDNDIDNDKSDNITNDDENEPDNTTNDSDKVDNSDIEEERNDIEKDYYDDYDDSDSVDGE